MNDLVTIVTTATPEYHEMLREALASVERQTVPTRVVVICYGDPMFWYERFAGIAVEECPLWINFPTEPFVLSAARNYGIAEVTTPYVICLDADDMMEPSFVERHIELAAPDTFVTCGFRIMGQTEHHLSPLFTDFSLAGFLEGNKAIVSTMFPKAAWAALGGFRGWRDTNYLDDWKLWTAAAAAGYRWRLVPEHLLVYRDNFAGLSAKARRQGIIEEARADFRAEFGPSLVV